MSREDEMDVDEVERPALDQTALKEQQRLVRAEYRSLLAHTTGTFTIYSLFSLIRTFLRLQTGTANTEREWRWDLAKSKKGK